MNWTDYPSISKIWPISTTELIQYSTWPSVSASYWPLCCLDVTLSIAYQVGFLNSVSELARMQYGKACKLWNADNPSSVPKDKGEATLLVSTAHTWCADNVVYQVLFRSLVTPKKQKANLSFYMPNKHLRSRYPTHWAPILRLHMRSLVNLWINTSYR